MADHPFQIGARVCIARGSTGYGVRTYTEDVVLKVYKNGNFTLKSDPRQQWSPNGPTTARKTGDGYNRPQLTVWNDATEAHLKAKIAESQRYRRWQNVLGLDRVSYDRATDEAIDLLERGIAALKPKEPGK